MNKLSIKFATKDDVYLILDFIKKFAEYERLENEVVATPELLNEWIFEKQKAEVLIAYEDKKPVGFTLFCHNFSTFLGKAGIWIEDIFVLEEYRHKGYGKELLKSVVKLAIERNCGRIEWSCLDWNQPSIDFYLSLDARAMDEWTTYRLEGENLKNFCENH